MTHYAINLHRQPGDLEPGHLHGSIGLHGDRDGISLHVDGYRTRWSVSLSAADAAELARSLVDDKALGVASLRIGRAVVDTNADSGLVTLAVRTDTARMSTEMTLADAKELALALTTLANLGE